MLQNAKTATVALGETLRLALDTLRSHKLRSFLTLLGVILAVTTLVVVMSVIEGLNRYISDKVANLGSNAFIIDRFGIITSHEEWLKAQRRSPLRLEDYEAVRDRMQLAERVAAAFRKRTDVRYGNELLEDVALVGMTPNYVDIYSISVANGRFLNEIDEQHRSAVCFIGTDIANRFFPHVDPIGRTMRIGSQTYEVVGVAKPLGTIFGQSRDGYVLIPLGTYVKTWAGSDESLYMLIQAKNTELIDAAQDEARVILRARRHVRYNDPDNFGIFSSSSITGLWRRLTGNIFAIAVGLTSIFMVVGGIVIMNIMLASVVERTREIGIRKSVGARRRHIVTQFLVESAVLAASGGLIGIALALALAALGRAVTAVPMTTPVHAVVVALTLSTAIGLFFGIYPAVRASRLDPIEALRHEV